MNLKSRLKNIEKKVGKIRLEKEKDKAVELIDDWHITLSPEDRIVMMRIVGAYKREKEGQGGIEEVSPEECKRYLQLDKEFKRFAKNKGYRISGFMPEVKKFAQKGLKKYKHRI